MREELLKRAKDRCRKLIEEEHLQIAQLREDQLIEAIVQAIQCGDFAIHIDPDDNSKAVYKPYARFAELLEVKQKLRELRDTIRLVADNIETLFNN